MKQVLILDNESPLYGRLETEGISLRFEPAADLALSQILETRIDAVIFGIQAGNLRYVKFVNLLRMVDEKVVTIFFTSSQEDAEKVKATTEIDYVVKKDKESAENLREILQRVAAPNAFVHPKIDSIKTVLVADDSRSILTVFSNYFDKKSDIALITAKNGQEAWDKINKHKVDLIISDINMPGMGGVELMTALKRHQITIPMVLMSVKSKEEINLLAKKFPIAGYLQKPFRLENIDQLLQTLCDSE